MPVTDEQLDRIRLNFMNSIYSNPIAKNYVKDVSSSNRPDESVLIATLYKEIPKEAPKAAFPAMFQGVWIQYMMDD